MNAASFYCYGYVCSGCERLGDHTAGTLKPAAAIVFGQALALWNASYQIERTKRPSLQRRSPALINDSRDAIEFDSKTISHD